MAADTLLTAPTRFVEASGIRYAYRRFGSEMGLPLVFLQHFRGGLDNWDPLVTDGLAVHPSRTWEAVVTTPSQLRTGKTEEQS